MNKSDIEIIRYVTALADRYHGEQVRKYTGERYIVHPLRVMEMVREFNSDIRVLSAALLHDVLEDTPVTAENMAQSLLEILDSDDAQNVTKLVIELTDIFIKADYPGLNRRRRKEREATRLSQAGSGAQTIKYADLIDNVTDIVRQDTDFARVYVQEAKKMLMVMDAGHPVLRERAMRVVEQSLTALKKTRDVTV
ncbi:MAG: HD domain-containing protein, partial [Cyclobacteriaceae bacterium]